MARLKSEEAAKEAVRMTAAMMAASARTAPKGRGVDALETLIVDADDLEVLASAMERKAQQGPSHLSSIFSRDANNVRDSSCVLLIGVVGIPKKVEEPLDCGACGYDTCGRLLEARGQRRRAQGFGGPICIFQAVDVGNALRSAVKLAGELNIDNRLMYTVGAAAKELRLLDCDAIVGIPLSVTGKSPYFDRQWSPPVGQR
jgi:uncharacterized ferredoxin-like protein